MMPPLGPWEYAAHDRLGGGGYAQAYRSRDGGHAVKVFDDPHHVNTFDKEVRALRLLQGCPGTPALVDCGRNREGRLCIVTTLAAGTRLDKRIRAAGPLSPELTLSLLEQLLAVLACAHGRGLLHKDIKASNVLFDGTRFTLLDWGVAEPRGDGRSETIRAKQDFVAPECYYGEHDFATDFYALGWLAVYALSGALPYHCGEVADPAYRVAAHCLERPELPPGIPQSLRATLLAWFDKRPARRPVAYDLAAAQAAAEKCRPDFIEYLDFRQLSREFGYLHLAARHGVPYAQWRFAAQLLDQGLRREAIYWLERARQNGYSEATYLLAKTLARGGEEERRAAAEWLRCAADAGHARAQYELGRLLEKESGGREEAAAYLARAAERGYPEGKTEAVD